MQNKEQIQEAVDVLKDARDKVYPLLTAFPALQVRSLNALDTLMAGLSHTIQGALPSQIDPANKTEPLTHIFGNKVSRDTKPVPAAKVQVTEADVEDLRERVLEAYDTFRERDNKGLMDSLTDMEIRGVARMAGMESVTATEPKKIASPFIDKIKAAILKKAEQEAAEREAEKIIETKTPGTPETPAAGTGAENTAGATDGTTAAPPKPTPTS